MRGNFTAPSSTPNKENESCTTLSARDRYEVIGPCAQRRSHRVRDKTATENGGEDLIMTELVFYGQNVYDQALLEDLLTYKKIHHPNLFPLYDCFVTKDPDLLCFITPDLIDLKALITRQKKQLVLSQQKLNEAEALSVVEQIHSAACCLHEAGLTMYGGSAPIDVYVVRKNPIVVSINMPRAWKTQYSYAGLVLGPDFGSVEFQSPQYCYGEKTDVWSLGVWTYFLICGRSPNGGTNNWTFSGFPSPEWDSISEKTKKFIRNTLAIDPQQRPSLQECLQYFSHPELLMPLLLARHYQPESPFFKDSLPLDLFRLILHESKLGKLPKLQKSL